MTKDFDEETFIIMSNTLDEVSNTLDAFFEGMTGILTSKKEDRYLSLGNIFQRWREGNFLKQLLLEWDGYRKKGKIKDDYHSSQQHQECLQEILDYLDNNLPNQITFDILKKIFLLASTESISDRESLLPQAYMRIIKKLSPEAILVLFTTYNIYKTISPTEIKKAGEGIFSTPVWLEEVAKKSGLKYPELITIYEKEIIDMKLITDRGLNEDTFSITDTYRLTKLGYDLCNYIEKYEVFG